MAVYLYMFVAKFYFTAQQIKIRIYNEKKHSGTWDDVL